MTQFGDQIAWKTLMGSAWYLAQTTMTGAGADFYYVRDPEARRFYGILCMAYASDPKTFGFLARNLDIPSRRIDKCIEDFVRVQQAFDATIPPRVDQILLQKVRAMPWLSPVTPQ
jgi:Putative metallopeptidase